MALMLGPLPFARGAAPHNPRNLLCVTVRDLVNQAYGLTPAEIDLMWQTAPPRMPIPRPAT